MIILFVEAAESSATGVSVTRLLFFFVSIAYCFNFAFSAAFDIRNTYCSSSFRIYSFVLQAVLFRRVARPTNAMMESVPNKRCPVCRNIPVPPSDRGLRNSTSDMTHHRFLHTPPDRRGSFSGRGIYSTSSSPTELDWFVSTCLLPASSSSDAMEDRQHGQLGSALVETCRQHDWKPESVSGHQQRKLDSGLASSYSRLQSPYCPHCVDELGPRCAQNVLVHDLMEAFPSKDYCLHRDMPLDNDFSPLSPRMPALFQLGPYSEGNPSPSSMAGQDVYPTYPYEAPTPRDCPIPRRSGHFSCVALISSTDDSMFEDILHCDHQRPCFASRRMHLEAPALPQFDKPSSVKGHRSFNGLDLRLPGESNILQTFGKTVFQLPPDSSYPYLVDSAVSPTKTKRSIRADQRVQFYKTRLCPHLFSLAGYCRRKAACSYAHSISELRPSVDLTKTKLCQDFLCGSCQKRDCTFAHGIQELRGLPNGD